MKTIKVSVYTNNIGTAPAMELDGYKVATYVLVRPIDAFTVKMEGGNQFFDSRWDFFLERAS